MAHPQIQFNKNSDLISFTRKSSRAVGGEFTAEASSLFHVFRNIPETFDLTVRATGNVRTFYAFRTETDAEGDVTAWIYETRDSKWERMVFVVFND